MPTLTYTDANGNTQTVTTQQGSNISIANVVIDERIVVSASAVPITGQQPVVESVEFIGPSRAGQPVTKKC